MITGLYAAIFALLQIVFTLKVVKLRWGKKVSLGDGGEEALMRKIRAHGNFVETVPMALVLMIIAELSGAPLWSIHVLGALMVVSRLMHYVGVTSGSGHGKLRIYGMVITLGVFILGALLCFWLALSILLAA